MDYCSSKRFCFAGSTSNQGLLHWKINSTLSGAYENIKLTLSIPLLRKNQIPSGMSFTQLMDKVDSQDKPFLQTLIQHNMPRISDSPASRNLRVHTTTWTRLDGLPSPNLSRKAIADILEEALLLTEQNFED
jgi:hypothetical protein